MSNASLSVFQNTLQKTDYWLKEIMIRLDLDDRQRAYQALKAVLHALRDRLPIEVAAKLGAQLPMLVRGFYYEGWVPSKTPIKVHSLDDFLDLVLIYLHNSPLVDEIDNIEFLVKSVFEVMQEQLSEGEISHVKKAVPASIAALWEPKGQTQQRRKVAFK